MTVSRVRCIQFEIVIFRAHDDDYSTRLHVDNLFKPRVLRYVRTNSIIPFFRVRNPFRDDGIRGVRNPMSFVSRFRAFSRGDRYCHYILIVLT